MLVDGSRALVSKASMASAAGTPTTPATRPKIAPRAASSPNMPPTAMTTISRGANEKALREKPEQPPWSARVADPCDRRPLYQVDIRRQPIPSPRTW